MTVVSLPAPQSTLPTAVPLLTYTVSSPPPASMTSRPESA
jgi:hypothetical protein